MKRWSRLPLSTRLALLVLGAEFAILGLFAATVYVYCRREFLRAFDSALLANAEAIASRVERDASGKVELEAAGGLDARFARRKSPDLFLVVDAGGAVLFQSGGLAGLPPGLSGMPDHAVFSDFTWRARPYRGVVIRAAPEDSAAGPAGGLKVWVFYGSSAHGLQERLEDVVQFLAWALGLLLLVSGGLAGWVARRGLAPLRRLAADTGAIGAATLHRRLATEGLPADLVALAGSVNGLLERIAGTLERERQFSADAAHELRTPVSTLKSGIQAALVSPREAGEDRRVLEDLLEDVTRLEALCEALLAMAGAEGAHAAPGLAASEWLECVTASVEEFRPAALRSGAVLELAVERADAGAAGSLRADRVATRRVLANLVDNALRHGGPGHRVDVRARLGPAGATLLVEDDGPGVPPEDEPRLFDRFFRADRARARANGGTGLGLALSRALARSLGGDLEYEHRAPGGSRFVWTVTAAGVPPQQDQPDPQGRVNP